MLAAPIGVITGHLFEALTGATGDLRQNIGLLGLLLLLPAHLLALGAQLLGRLASDRAALDFDGAALTVGGCRFLLLRPLLFYLYHGGGARLPLIVSRVVVGIVRWGILVHVARLLRHAVVVVVLMVVINRCQMALVAFNLR